MVSEEKKLKHGHFVFLNSYGEVVIKRLCDVKKGLNWYMLNHVTADSVSKSDFEFLKKYGLEPTIFNVGSLVEFRHIHLYPHFIEVVLSYGAIDKREHEA